MAQVCTCDPDAFDPCGKKRQGQEIEDLRGQYQDQEWYSRGGWLRGQSNCEVANGSHATASFCRFARRDLLSWYGLSGRDVNNGTDSDNFDGPSPQGRLTASR